MKTTAARPDRNGRTLPQHLLERAAQWRVELDAPDTPFETHQAFERWRTAHADHDQAWQAINATWNAVAGAGGAEARKALEHTLDEEKKDVRRWLGRSAGLLLMLLALVPLAWFANGILPPAHLLADHRTAIGEIQTVELPDGSRMVLNTATAVDVRFDEQRRRVHLHEGQIHITVAQDGERPLEVLTDQGVARALGTRFDVRRLDSDNGTVTRVGVKHSRVEICPANNGACRELQRGQQADVDGQRVSKPVTIDPNTSAAWTNGQQVVDNAPVTEVLRELARYRRGFLRIDDAELTGVRVSGVIPLQDTDRALSSLESTLPLRVQRYTPWVVNVSRDP